MVWEISMVNGRKFEIQAISIQDVLRQLPMQNWNIIPHQIVGIKLK